MVQQSEQATVASPVSCSLKGQTRRDSLLLVNDTISHVKVELDARYLGGFTRANPSTNLFSSGVYL